MKRFKKILSFTIALALTVSLMPNPTQIYANDTANTTAAPVLPNLDNLRRPTSGPKREKPVNITPFSKASSNNPIRLRKDYVSPVTEVNEFTEQGNSKALLLPQVAEIGGTTSIIGLTGANNDTSAFTATVAAIGNKCVVYVVSGDNIGDAEADVFLPAGTTANQKAQEIATEFDDFIFPLIGSNRAMSYIGEYIRGESEKVNIILYDIEGDGGNTSGGGYIAGFFSGADYGNENSDALLHIDIGTNGGYSQFDEDISIFYGTIIHEFQHMITFSNFLKNLSEGKISFAPGDPDVISPATTTTMSLWLNEGLSGVAQTLYNEDKVDPGHLAEFLGNKFAPGTGQVPTTAQWGDAGENVYANYGASSMLVNVFYAHTFGASLNRLSIDPRVGFINSKIIVGEHPFGSFNTFFTRASLDIAVDNVPAAITELEDHNEVAFYQLTSDSMWYVRNDLTENQGSDYPSEVGYAGVLKLEEDTEVSSNGASYYTNLFMDDIGSENNTATITIPEDTKTDYLIITPFNATEINDNEEWINAPKISAYLEPGDNEVVVGTGNRFAVLAITYEDATDESITYSKSAQALKTVTFDPQNGTSATKVYLPESSTITLPKEPDKVGYIFDGWYTVNDGTGEQLNDGDTITADTTVYAKWLEAVEITFNSQTGQLILPIYIVKGTTVTTTLPVPTRLGYTFMGWYTAINGGTKFTSADVVNTNITLYARWQIYNSGTVGGGGSGSGSGGGGTSESSSDRVYPSSSTPTTATDTKYTATTITEKVVDTAISTSKDTIAFVLTESNAEVDLDNKTVEKIIKNGKPLSFTQGNVALTVSATTFAEIEATNSGKAVSVVLNKFSTTLLEDVQKNFNSVASPINKQLLSLGESITIKVDGETFTNFATPLALSFDVSKVSIPAEQLKNLTAVRLGNDNKKENLGGDYNSNTGILTAYTNSLSNYTVMVDEKLVSVNMNVNNKNYKVNGINQTANVAPVMVNGSVLVPIRFLGEAFGAKITWNEEVKTATVNLDGKTLKIIIGQKAPGMDVPAQIIDGRTMVPLRYVIENFGANVVWYPQSKTVKAYK